jgi:hypothetical protein
MNDSVASKKLKSKCPKNEDSVEEVAACLKVSEENVITEVEDHVTRTVDNIGFPVYPGSVCSNVQNHGI